MARRRRTARTRRLSLPQLVPNLMTLGAICAGLTSIRFSIDGRFGEAVAMIAVAAVLDALDGGVARMLRSESAIGAELDSLADFLNFGVGAGLLVYLALLQGLNDLGWIAVLIYVVGCVMRLARFNVDARAPSPGPSLGGFIGVPSPAGALLALMPLFVERALPGLPAMPGQIAAAWLVIVAFLLVSRIPTPSLKQLRVRPDNLPYFVILLVAVIAMLFTWPWWTLLAGSLAYLLAVLWSLRRRPRTEGTPAPMRPDHET